MESRSLRELEAAVQAAKVERAKARGGRVHTMQVESDALDAQIRATQKEIAENKRNHRGVAGLAKRNHRLGRFTKSQEKKARSGKFANEADDAILDLAILVSQKEHVKEELDRLKTAVGLAAIEEHYYGLRHELLLKRQELDRGNEAALRMKRLYMQYAGIWTASPDKVLYYVRNQEIHLFYGGGKNYHGPGNSPDGRGHGHVTLVPDLQRKYKIQFVRRPSR